MKAKEGQPVLRDHIQERMTRSATTMGHREPATHRSPGRPGPRGGSQEHGCGSLPATQDTGKQAGCSLDTGLCLPRKGPTHPLTVSSRRGWGQTPSPRCLRRGRAGRGLHQKPMWRARVMSGARKPARGPAALGSLEAPSCESRTRQREEGV